MTPKPRLDIPDKFIIVATKRDESPDGHPIETFVYHKLDSHTGGHPYWSNWISMVEVFDDLDHALKDLKEVTESESNRTRRDISDIRIVRWISYLNVVESDEITENKIRTAKSKLTDEEKKLLGLEGGES